jgi:hypothetical protein
VLRPISGQTKSLKEAGRDQEITAEGYKVTFNEHPDAIFYLTPTYFTDAEDNKTQTGWQIENVNSGIRAVSASSVSETFNLFVTKFKQLQNASVSNDQVVDIISVTKMDINKLTPDENAEVKYTFLSLPFTKAEKETILVNFADKYMKGKSTREAQKYIEEALEKRDAEGQKEIIELLKECYK